ncbi:hypothetical protein NDU88_005581 [Pleurodeles waltl]|uniref:Uncharacterized protein n=1 Tax=Pleurodeles waltl TaxID=8319 RepID=A0AAV7PFZ0_PLEWA|nr:hypothetical protein NDU88_005581 [Pleurodeles waltl]
MEGVSACVCVWCIMMEGKHFSKGNHVPEETSGDEATPVTVDPGPDVELVEATINKEVEAAFAAWEGEPLSKVLG